MSISSPTVAGSHTVVGATHASIPTTTTVHGAATVLPLNYAAEIIALEAQVARETSVEQSAQTLIAGLVQKLHATGNAISAGADPSIIHNLANEMEAHNTALSAAVAANIAATK